MQKRVQCVNEKDDNSYVSYDYSCRTSNCELSAVKNRNDNDKEFQCGFVTPPSHFGGRGRTFIDAQSCNFLLPLENSDEKQIQRNEQPKLQTKKDFREICVNLNAESFFGQLDANLVVNFEESPIKVQNNANFKKTFEEYPIVQSKDLVCSKIDSCISAPLVRQTSSIGLIDQENEEDAPFCKDQNIQPSAQCKDIEKGQLKVSINQRSLEMQKKEHNHCHQMRRRVLHKNNEKLPINDNQKKERFLSKATNPQSLMIVASKSQKWWTDQPKNKKSVSQANTQTIKTCEKTVKKGQKNIFNIRQMFKETLKSTTLDNWKKKFNIQKQQLDSKHKANVRNIFQMPFAIIR